MCYVAPLVINKPCRHVMCKNGRYLATPCKTTTFDRFHLLIKNITKWLFLNVMEVYWWLDCYSPPRLTGVGHQWMVSTSIGCNQWLSRAKPSLKVAHASRNRSLVAHTSKCRWAIRQMSCKNVYNVESAHNMVVYPKVMYAQKPT